MLNERWHILFEGHVLSALIPMIQLQSDKYADHHQEDLATGIEEVTCDAALGQYELADMAEDLDHVEV